MTELEELRLAYAECSRQRFELLAKLKNLLQDPEPVVCNECKEWEKVCDQHLRHIKKLKAKREWQGLTDEDKQEAFDETQEASGGFWEFAEYLEAKLKAKNGFPQTEKNT